MSPRLARFASVPSLFVSVALMAGAVALTSSCHPTERYESVGQLLRADVVEVDEKDPKKATMLEIEIEWDPCPGDQFQVIRGGAEFAACMKQYEGGDYLSLVVDRFWDSRGYYRWEVVKVGECDRPMQIDAEGSYEKSQECDDVMHHGVKAGFTCSRKPFAKLVSVCPWMARD